MEIEKGDTLKIKKCILFISLTVLFFALFACSSDKNPVQSSTFPSSGAEAQKLDGKLLSELVNQIDSGAYGEIHSLLIVRNDFLVLEEYFRGYNRDQLHYLYSVTKSVTSALIGIAIHQGKIKGLDEKLLGFFPEYDIITNKDARKEAITLEDLLTMTAGFSWDEWSTPYGSPQNDASKLAQSGDWMKYMLDLPMSEYPGIRFVYNSGCTMLLAGIIKNSTGKSAEEFAVKNLFEPIKIARWQWETGPKGITNTGWGLHLRPIDMAQFGSLYLHKGRWKGKNSVPEDWVARSTKESVSIDGNFDYGYQWWRFSDNSSVGRALQTNDLYFAWGYGGQFIFVIPHLNMIVVITADNFSNSSQTFTFLEDYILAAVKDN